MPDANSETGNIARDSKFRSLIENSGTKDVRRYVERTVERDRGVIDQRSQRTRFYRNAPDRRTGRRRGRRRNGSMQNRIALEFLWIDRDRSWRSRYRLCRGQTPNFRSEFCVLFLYLV